MQTGAAMFDDRTLLATLAALLLLVIIAWLATNLQTRRRNQGLAGSFDDATRSRLIYARTASARGFDAHFEPAPEPFTRLELRYRSGATVDPIGLFARFLTGRSDELVIRARLPDRPTAELVWERGRIPERALARRARTSLWIQRRSDLIDSEYAVRGTDTTALEYVFVDLQARFGALLQRVSVVADREDVHIEVYMRGAELRTSDAPALVTTLRSLGRAAQRR
jgi:hypothetical protein